VIASVSGRVAALGPDGAVVEVGGVGLAISCTPGVLARLRVGDAARLSTSLVVREDSLTLYGFADDDERSLFELLQTASGVGPRLAQAILAVHPPTDVRRAVATADIPALTRVPGIGKKGAERLVLELRDKVASVARVPVGVGATGAAPSGRDHVVEALVGLGFPAKQAEQAVDAVLSETGGENGSGNGSANGSAGQVDTAATLRIALSRLSKAR
jgi:holliday junction DNA helicase RuvA